MAGPARRVRKPDAGRRPDIPDAGCRRLPSVTWRQGHTRGKVVITIVRRGPCGLDRDAALSGRGGASGRSRPPLPTAGRVTRARGRRLHRTERWARWCSCWEGRQPSGPGKRALDQAPLVAGVGVGGAANVEVPRVRYLRPVFHEGHRHAVGVAGHRRDPRADRDLNGGESPGGVLRLEFRERAGSRLEAEPIPVVGGLPDHRVICRARSPARHSV